MRTVTTKNIQTHFECVCGRNVVDHEEVKIKWRDFSKAGIVRKVDKSTGKPFLLRKESVNTCSCYED